METIVFETVGRVLNILSDHITKQLRYVASSRKYVTDMRNRMDHLNGRSDDVTVHVNRNHMYNREIPARVPVWLADVEKLRNEVESIPSNAIRCLHMKTRYQAGRNASKATKEIEKLIAEEFMWTDAPLPTGRPTSSTTSIPSSSSSGENGFKSREKPFNDALKFLQQDDNKSQVVALCGFGGIGKTTMMKQLKMVADQSKMFGLFVEVTIGRNPKMSSIQNGIAECLGGEGLHEMNEATRVERLREMFKTKLEKEKKGILVILDDVWETINLEHIGLISPLPNGVKLFLTSRDATVCGVIAAEARSGLQVVEVGALLEAEASNLFSSITEVSEENDEKHLLGIEIVNKCGRLPLAICLIASTLKFQELSAWKKILTRLKNNHLVDKVHESIKISYEYRTNEEKQILLLCGLFPEDYDIPIEVLMRYAWGLEVSEVISNYTLGDARDNTISCVSNLVSASFLIKSDYLGCVKLHDLVLAYVLDEVLKSYPSWIINHGDVFKWDRDESSESCKRISLTCTGMSKFPTDFECSHLSLLQLMHGDQLLKFPNDFYGRMRNLKVMACYNMEYPLLIRSLECCTNLRTLSLHGCNLMFDLSFVGDLVNLEELSFANCGISKLPSTIRNLAKLKVLDVTGCVNLLIDDGVFRNLKCLKELYMRVAGREHVRFTEASFKEFKILLVQLGALEVEFVEDKTPLKMLFSKKLQKFKISIGCPLEEKEKEKYSPRNTLKLVTNSYKDLSDCKINELFHKTEKLHLDVKDMIRLKDVVSSHLYDKRLFCNLRELKISNCENLEYLFTIHVASGLSKLEHLTISSCPVLQAVVHNDEIKSVDDVIKFEELKFLSLEELPGLVSLFPSNSVVELPQLVELELQGLPNFTSIYPNNSIISLMQHPFLNDKVTIPQLEKLKIKSMEKLKQIWACNSKEAVNGISMLRDIEVKNCDSLENLFPTNPMLLLSHLQSLYVEKCASIKEIFNIDLGCVGVLEQPSRSRLRIICPSNLKKLREVWRVEGGEENSGNSGTLLIHGFEAVEIIEIRFCMMFRSVSTCTYVKFDMRALTNMRIYNSTAEKIVTSFAFPSNKMHSFHHLEDLVLEKNNDVEVVFDIKSNRELVTTANNSLLPNIQHLLLKYMNKMSHVWKCSNWNKFLTLENQSSFHNLTTIQIWGCHRLQYLLSPLMAKLLSNLKEISIRFCDGMEEVVSKRDDKDDEERIGYTTTTTSFPHLHKLSFLFLKNLKRIGGADDDKVSRSDGIVSWSLCQYPKEMHIYSCNKLSSVIPSYAVGQMQKLEVLTVRECESLMEVFETQGVKNNNNWGGVGTSLAGPRTDIISVPQLSNLMKLEIYECKLVQHVFTFSTLESLGQLQELKIQRCSTMNVVVKNEDRDLRKVVKFPRLQTLELRYLPNLEGFFLGSNEIEWSSLEKVVIEGCPRMKVFTTGESRVKELKHIYTGLGKHSTLECGLNFHVTPGLHHQELSSSSENTSMCLEPLPWSFHNLIDLYRTSSNHKIRNIIPSSELQHVQKLETIRVWGCDDVEEVFEVVGMIKGTNNESQTVVIPNLREVKLEFMKGIKYIWKSINHHVALEFPNLTTLEIWGCDSLKHVFTSSMVGSLPRLQELCINSSNRLEVIIANKEVEEEEEESMDDANNVVQQTVALPCLKVLKLQSLEHLKGFCLGKVDISLPTLDTLEITKCPEIKLFTNGNLLDTPSLDIIHTEFGRCYVGEEDINFFIKTKQQEGYRF